MHLTLVVPGMLLIFFQKVDYSADTCQSCSVTIDTACSGALVALHLACQALQAGECDGAVIGASNLFLSPDYALSLTRLGAIAADGQCKTFDAKANGYGRGEGTNAVYVKRLSDAIRDGDNIRAVIRGTSSNRYVCKQG